MISKFEIRWSHEARKAYENFDSVYQKRFKRMVEILEQSPYHHAKSIKRLSGDLSGLHRYRVGKLRIFYIIFSSEKAVYIANIDTRGDAY